MAATKYRIETFSGAADSPHADKFFWHIKRSGKIIATSGEGLSNRKARDKVAKELFETLKRGSAVIVELKEPPKVKAASAAAAPSAVVADDAMPQTPAEEPPDDDGGVDLGADDDFEGEVD